MSRYKQVAKWDQLHGATATAYAALSVYLKLQMHKESRPFYTANKHLSKSLRPMMFYLNLSVGSKFLRNDEAEMNKHLSNCDRGGGEIDIYGDYLILVSDRLLKKTETIEQHWY
jgi:hypothetical protein